MFQRIITLYLTMNNKFKNVTLTAYMMEYVTKLPDFRGTAIIVIQQLFTTAVNMSTVI